MVKIVRMRASVAERAKGLKLIPQLFFDLIGRVVPGALGVVACLLLSGTTWESWLRVILGESLATDSLPVAILIFLAAAYVVGQLLSPAAKLVQRIGELKYFGPKPKAVGYDWLRLHHPENPHHEPIVNYFPKIEKPWLLP